MKNVILKIAYILDQKDYEKEYKKIIYNQNNLKNDFKNLLLYAAKHIPYWKEKLFFYEVVKNNEVNFNNFKNLPILTKKIIRNNFNILRSDEYKKRGAYLNMTGGSTGEPTLFFQDSEYRRWRHAANAYYYREILGIDEKKAKKLFLWGSGEDLFKSGIGIKTKVKNWLQNSVFLNCFKMGEKDMEKYISIINYFKPEVIRGYTGALYELARFAREKNFYLYTPNVIIATAETVTDSMRETIEEVFKTKVYNFYGSREVSAIAGECKNGLFHIFSFFNHVEILKTGSKESKEGKIFVTNLHNYSMPFIRYDIGDFAELGPSKCGCGNPLPTLKKLTGRVIEHLRTKEGKLIPGEYFIHLIGVIYNKGAIRQFQIIQLDYNYIKILVILEKKLEKEDKENINKKIRIVMGKDCKIEWKNVSEIPKTKSGKYLYTISELNKNEK